MGQNAINNQSRPASSRPSTRMSSPGPSAELLDILERLGKLTDDHETLKARVDALELNEELKNKLDKSALDNLNISGDFLDQLAQLKEDLKELQDAREKINADESASSSIALLKASSILLKVKKIARSKRLVPLSESEEGEENTTSSDGEIVEPTSEGILADIHEREMQKIAMEALLLKVNTLEDRFRVLQEMSVSDDSAYQSDVSDLKGWLNQMEKREDPLAGMRTTASVTPPSSTEPKKKTSEEDAIEKTTSGTTASKSEELKKKYDEKFTAEIMEIFETLDQPDEPSPMTPPNTEDLPLQSPVALYDTNKKIKALAQVLNDQLHTLRDKLFALDHDLKRMAKGIEFALHRARGGGMSDMEKLFGRNSQNILTNQNISKDILTNKIDSKDLQTNQIKDQDLVPMQNGDNDEKSFDKLKEILEGDEIRVIDLKKKLGKKEGLVDSDALSRAQQAILQLQAEVEKLHNTTKDIIEENNNRNKQIDVISQLEWYRQLDQFIQGLQLTQVKLDQFIQGLQLTQVKLDQFRQVYIYSKHRLRFSQLDQFIQGLQLTWVKLDQFRQVYIYSKHRLRFSQLDQFIQGLQLTWVKVFTVRSVHTGFTVNRSLDFCDQCFDIIHPLDFGIQFKQTLLLYNYYLNDLFQYCDKLQEIKADKEYVQMEVDVEDNMKTSYKQLNDDLDGKLDRLELDPLKEWLESKLKALNDKLKRHQLQSVEWTEDDAAGIRKQLIQRFHCISCDRPVDLVPTGPVPSLPTNTGLPPTRSPRPYTTFELDQIRQHAKSFNIQIHGRVGSSADSIYTSKYTLLNFSIGNSPDLITVRTYVGIDKPGIRFASPEVSDYYATTRPCGGSHTLTHPHKRITRIAMANIRYLEYKENAYEANISSIKTYSKVPFICLEKMMEPSILYTKFERCKMNFFVADEITMVASQQQKTRTQRPVSARVPQSPRPTSARVTSRPQSARQGGSGQGTPGPESSHTTPVPPESPPPEVAVQDHAVQIEVPTTGEN
ncbi:hypothetical protein KUTeg_004630 [Tegillarca granosa]|uniref:DUF4795 domain-containing protein n=1 Tax=Tegillarca granosa TaxID=220873 RepID=A0ABQ9FNT0_TEGGR|nr:hypothetical protein KUTeg_004630 [Tegillarca granosa]